MKKYLMFVMAAVAFVGCANHDFDTPSQEQIDKAKYDAAFINYLGGRPAGDQDWGFGSTTRSITRGAMPATPSFRDTNPIVKPTVSSAFKNTLSEAIAAGAKYAKDYQNYQKGDILYINTAYQTLNQPQNTEDLTIYVDGNVTYCGGTNQNGNGTVFCVTENSTLKLGAVSTNLTVYLAPGATLDITEGLNWDGTPAVDYVWNPETSTTDQVPKTSFSFQNSHAAIYISTGSKVKAGNLTLINGAKLLNNGGSIEANNLTLDQEATLWNEGSIKVANTLTLTNMTSQFYNKEGKTVETANLDLINNNALLYNDGTVTATGAITLHNTNAEIINYGTLSGASFSSAAGGKMHNEGTGVVNITGKTDLTNSNSTWMNDGQWTCGSFDVDNYSHTNINNCRLTVNGNFHLNRGTFVLSANSGVVCESFTWEDTSDFYLGSNSVLKINGNLLTKNANSGYGFRGTGSEYAVIQAARIYHEGNEQFRMSYYGKLLVATQNHFDQWYKDSPNTNQPAYWYESTVKFTTDGDNINTIPATDCNPGYEGTPDTSEYDLRIIAEDLSATSASDFDFNDVVIDIKYGSPAKIVLVAAGGTLELKVGSNNGVGGVEVHEAMLGADNARYGNVYKMINTDYPAPAGTTAPNADITDDINMSINSPADANNLRIEVYKNGSWQLLTAIKGEPACKLAVDPTFKILKERQSIKNECPKFVQWATENNFTSKWW